jgi:glycosyltransferase involved in cell wall biosynthesis
MADARRLVPNASCLLFQMLWEEGIGLVIIEAMACRVPVAAHNGTIQALKSVELQRNHVGMLDRRAPT